jgi:hypothetical protein
MSDVAHDLSLAQINAKMIGAAEAIRIALDELRRRNSEAVEAKVAYREARAKRRPELRAKLVADREDELFLKTRDEWFRAEMAATLKDSAWEALRASMAILSGLQSVASAFKEEAKLASWGQGDAA